MGNRREGERNCSECVGAGVSPLRTGVPKDIWLAPFCCVHKLCGLLLCGWGVTQVCLPTMSWPQLPASKAEANTCLVSEAAMLIAALGLIVNLLPEFPLAGAFFPPTRPPTLLIVQSIQFNVTSSGRPS